MKNLFLTGKVGVGKSTVLKKVLEKVNTSIGGYITERIINGPIRTYIVRSLYDNVEKPIIAKISSTDWSKEIFMDSFDTSIPLILDNSIKNRELIVLDELGFIENDIHNFTSNIYQLLDSDKMVFGVLKDYDCEFLNNIKMRDDVIVVEITEENRNKISENIIDILKSFGVPLKGETSFKWNKKRIDWYNKALEHPSSTYPHVFIKEIEKYTGSLEGKNVLDIGAGTGAFAIPLMKKGAYVTAIDSSFNMIDSLVQRAWYHNLDNMNCIISPFEKSNTSKHNIAISAFSGGCTKAPESIQKMYNLVNEYAFIISSFENQKDNFKTDVLYKMLNKPHHRKRNHKQTLANTLEILDELGYEYEYKEIEYELSQYFNSFDEGLEFFIDRSNIGKDDEIKRIEEFLEKFLIRKNGQYVFKNIKKSWLIAIKYRF